MSEEYVNELKLKMLEDADRIIDTLPDFSKRFFLHLKQKGNSPRTILQYAYDLRLFFAFLRGSAGFTNNESFDAMTASEMLDKLDLEDIQEYISTLETYEVKNGDQVKKKLSSPAAQARRLSSLRSMYRYFFRIGAIQKNMVDLIDLPKMPDKVVMPLEKEQIQRVIEAVDDTSDMSNLEKIRHSRIVDRDKAILITLLGTGIRVSELCGIDYTDIDYHNGTIMITRKGGDEDIVSFGSEVEDALLTYQDGAYMFLSAKNDCPAFFLSMQRKRLTPRSVEMLVKKYGEKAGINFKITPHTMRRTFATHLYEQTGDIRLTADALHHSSVDTTAKHYAKASVEKKRKAAKIADDLFK